MDLTGKRILVTGASSGIGKKTSQILSQLGGKVILLARNQERLQLTFEGLTGDGHAIYPFDLDAVDAIPGLMKKIAQEQGPLSGLFHSAGGGKTMSINIVKEKSIDYVFGSSLKAALLLTRGFIQKGVKSQGSNSLVFMSSAVAMAGTRGLSIYSASKAGIDGAMRCLACELAPQEIRVNSIVAGGVKTELHQEGTKNLSQAEISGYENRHLLGFGRSEDVAYAAAFLLSDAARWITGTTMIVDGGFCC